ncbi:MAG: signal recognition particle-docking protein FtsY [Clostridiaceae bacterium]|nr:signal recognition particle-docking protein FtsY [Clostridiaceae bacterium]
MAKWFNWGKAKRKEKIEKDINSDNTTELNNGTETYENELIDKVEESVHKDQAEFYNQVEFSNQDEKENEILIEEDLEKEKLDKKPSLFDKLKSGLKKTRDSITNRIDQVLVSFGKVDEELFEELEEVLITSDMGMETSLKIISELREVVKKDKITDADGVRKALMEIISSKLEDENTELELSTKPSVIVVIGVNGVGKTTSIGKIANLLKQQGKKITVAAADTFRAAAIDQLEIWTKRAGVQLIRHTEGADPSAVIFDAIQHCKSKGSDVLICDTAGRLHTKKNLMEELKKIFRIIQRELPGCDVETLLVLDATTGQNAVSQVKTFSEVSQITGLVLTKLDGTAKGGIIVSIKSELNVPVKFIGVGEQMDDLQPFNPKDFVKALFDV